MSDHGRDRRDSPIILELVGPPGSGKSSLARALSGAGDRPFAIGSARRDVRRAAFVRNALQVAVPFAAQARRMPTRRWYRYGIMIQLRSHLDVIRRWRGSGSVVMLDQGPVYLMSILQRALRGGGADHPIFRRYWEDTLSLWSRMLCLIVVLDASDDLLYQRIQQRGSAHRLLGKSPDEAVRMFSAGRHSRNLILRELRRWNPELMVIQLSAGEEAAHGLAARVRERVDTLMSAGHAQEAIDGTRGQFLPRR